MNNVTRLVVGGTSEVRGAETYLEALLLLWSVTVAYSSCAILGNVSVSAYRVTHSIFPLPNPPCNLSRFSERNNIMFPLHWWTVHNVALFFLFLPFVSTAPADGARFLIRLRPRHTYTTNTVPSAASFYVPTLPGLQQDPLHPLHIYAGHLNADPGVARLPDTAVTSHLYFVLIKARRTADMDRIMFWFNVSIIRILGTSLAILDASHLGGSRMFIL
jgi:hypothetical protein